MRTDSESANMGGHTAEDAAPGRRPRVLVKHLPRRGGGRVHAPARGPPAPLPRRHCQWIRDDTGPGRVQVPAGVMHDEEPRQLALFSSEAAGNLARARAGGPHLSVRVTRPD